MEEGAPIHAAVTETLRLYPSVPSDFKYVVADDLLPSGHFVPGGATLAYDPYVMGRLQSIWGADAADFRPERHLAPAAMHAADRLRHRFGVKIIRQRRVEPGHMDLRQHLGGLPVIQHDLPAGADHHHGHRNLGQQRGQPRRFGGEPFGFHSDPLRRGKGAGAKGAGGEGAGVAPPPAEKSRKRAAGTAASLSPSS